MTNLNNPRTYTIESETITTTLYVPATFALMLPPSSSKSAAARQVCRNDSRSSTPSHTHRAAAW